MCVYKLKFVLSFSLSLVLDASNGKTCVVVCVSLSVYVGGQCNINLSPWRVADFIQVLNEMKRYSGCVYTVLWAVRGSGAALLSWNRYLLNTKTFHCTVVKLISAVPSSVVPVFP